MSKVREVSLFISHWLGQLPSFPKGTLWNFNWHHSMCWVLMSISQTVFNSLAASPLTPTRNFKGALLWIPQSCIKNVNLGDMLTTRLCMLSNSNDESDHSGQGRKEKLTMPSACQPVHLSTWPSICFFPRIFDFLAFFLAFILRKIAESMVFIKNEMIQIKKMLTFNVRNRERCTPALLLYDINVNVRWLTKANVPILWSLNAKHTHTHTHTQKSWAGSFGTCVVAAHLASGVGL